MRDRGISLIEVLVAISIIAVITSLTAVSVTIVYKKGRDSARKASLSQIGRLLASQTCYVPDGGAGDYDIGDLWAEIKAKYPQYGQFLTTPPQDPRGGTDAVTKYRYVVTPDASACALYANLEYGNEAVTIEGISAPTPGRGTGVLQAATDGPNGTDRYFQVSNK